MNTSSSAHLHHEEETERRSSAALPILGFDVAVIEGRDVGAHVEVHAGTGRILIGTSEVCNLRLTDPAVSRRHAALEFRGYRMLLTDLGSTNGTFANGVSLLTAYITGRDLVRIGGTVLRFTHKP